jgi:hypothetical protein
MAWFCLPPEEDELITYLAKSGKLWAFSWNIDPTRPEYPAAPIADFFREHGDSLTRAHQQTSARWHEQNAAYWADTSAIRPNRDDWGEPRNLVHIGLRDAFRSPRIHEFERAEGGYIEPTGRPGVGQVVGATNVVRRTLDRSNEFLHYGRGAWHAHDDAFHGPSLSYESGATSTDHQRVGKQLFAWLRRWTPHSVTVAGVNYARRATQGAATEARKGTRFR